MTLEAYKHTLIPATNAAGNVIKDTFVDELELYNTKDIVDYLTNKAVNEEVDDSNRKQNIYLFEKSDEIYVRVYNTNITAGSVMYNMLMGAVNTKVIDVKYGGVVNNVNWELYNKMKVDTIATPKVILSVRCSVIQKLAFMGIWIRRSLTSCRKKPFPLQQKAKWCSGLQK